VTQPGGIKCLELQKIAGIHFSEINSPLPRLDNSYLLLYTYLMLARVYSFAVIDLDGVIVEVEVDTALGLPGMDIAGTPDL